MSLQLLHLIRVLSLLHSWQSNVLADMGENSDSAPSYPHLSGKAKSICERGQKGDKSGARVAQKRSESVARAGVGTRVG